MIDNILDLNGLAIGLSGNLADNNERWDEDGLTLSRNEEGFIPQNSRHQQSCS
jgi:hypothetical protein